MSLIVRGITSVLQMLEHEQVTPQLERKINPIIREGVQHMKQIAPVKTGYLRDRIFYDYLGNLLWEIHSEAPYSYFVEYGTSKMEAQPFFRPGVILIKHKLQTLKTVLGIT